MANIILNSGQAYELSELAKATENAATDLLYIVKEIDGNLTSIAITREQFLTGISGGGVTVEKGGTSIGTQPAINLIEGSNVTLDISNDAANNRVNITINAAGGSGSVAWGAITGTLADQTDLANALGGLANDISTNAGDIAINASDISDNTDDIADLSSDVADIEVDIADLQAEKLDASEFVEENLKGTATYNAAMTGTETLDLDAFSAHYGILTGNTTLALTNTPSSGETVTKSLNLKSDDGETLSWPGTWRYHGDYLSDGTLNDIQMSVTNYPTVGLIVTLFINQPST